MDDKELDAKRAILDRIRERSKLSSEYSSLFLEFAIIIFLIVDFVKTGDFDSKLIAIGAAGEVGAYLYKYKKYKEKYDLHMCVAVSIIMVLTTFLYLAE